MRRSISKIPYGLPTPSSSIAVFSTSSGGGGRGRGAPVPPFQFTAPDDNSKNPNLTGAPHGHGRGRGVPVAPSPSFSPFMNNGSAALGRGHGGNSDLPPPKPNVQMPSLFVNGEEAQSDSAESKPEKALPTGFFGVLSGAGRGKPGQSPPPQSVKPQVEARPTRAREQRQPSNREQLSQDEKVRRAVGVLSKGEEARSGAAPGGFKGVRAQGGERDRAQGGERERERERERDRDRDRDRDRERGRGGGYAGRGRGGYGGRGDRDEEMASKVLPSSTENALLDAYETNLRLEAEPEYFMEEFGTNPDIDEKPPIPLRDALEKMKPVLMLYEGIETQEEWEEIIEETMEKVPLMKEIIDHYGGPDRATAKQQQEELERVATTLPTSAPASLKRFTDRAVLSLKSNPGWGFDKKCQFMDKLIMEASQQYK